MSGTQLARRGGGGVQWGLSIPLCMHAYPANKTKLKADFSQRRCEKRGENHRIGCHMTA